MPDRLARQINSDFIYLVTVVYFHDILYSTNIINAIFISDSSQLHLAGLIAHKLINLYLQSSLHEDATQFQARTQANTHKFQHKGEVHH